MLGYCLSSQHAVLVGQKKEKKIKFLFCKLQYITTYNCLHIFDIQLHFVKDDSLTPLQMIPSEYGLEPGMQLSQIKRLGKVIVSPQVQSDDLVLQGIFCGDDQNIRCNLIFLDET